MTATTASISDLLKNQYEGPIREQLNLEAMIYDLFEEGPHQWAGASVHIPLHTRGVVTNATSGIHYGSEGAQGAVVPSASNQEYLERLSVPCTPRCVTLRRTSVTSSIVICSSVVA